MLEMIIRKQETLENNWVELELPKLVDELVANYDRYGDIMYLEGGNLPSNQTVIEILEDILNIFFPSCLGRATITKANIKHFLEKNLNSIHHRLVKELNKSLKYVCRRVETCPEDVCLRRAQVVAKEILEKIPEISILPLE